MIRQFIEDVKRSLQQLYPTWAAPASSPQLRNSLLSCLYVPIYLQGFQVIFSFFSIYTVLKIIVMVPIDLFIGLLDSLVAILGMRRRPHHGLSSFLLVIVGWVMTRDIAWFDVSYVYHAFRGQSTLKIYGLIFAFEINQKLLSTAGKYLLSHLSNKWASPDILTLIPQLIFCFIYTIMHTLSIFVEYIIYMVVFNSTMGNFLIFFFVINLTKMKSTAFKKFDGNAYGKQVNLDAKDRMHKTIYLFMFKLTQWDRDIVDIGIKLVLVYGIGSLIEYCKHCTILALCKSFPSLELHLQATFHKLYIKRQQRCLQKCWDIDFTVVPFCVFLIKMIFIALKANCGQSYSELIGYGYICLVLGAIIFKFCLIAIKNVGKSIAIDINNVNQQGSQNKILSSSSHLIRMEIGKEKGQDTTRIP